MKAALEFDLPEEQNEHLNAVHGTEWALVAMEINNEIGSMLHNGHSYKRSAHVLQHLQDKMFELMDRHELNFNWIEH